MKPVFIVTSHQSEKYRNNGHQFLDNYLSSLEDSINIDYDVIVVENGSERFYDLPKKFHYRFIPDQMIGGITRAWNIGVSMAIENGNDIICVTNDDIRFNSSINEFFNVINNFENKHSTVFGPVCDNPSTFKNQVSKTPIDKIIDITGKSVGLHGWFLTFTSRYYHTFNIQGSIFNPELPWGGQEKFQIRDWKKGARSVVVGKCLVHHHHTGGWRKIIK